MDACIDLGWCPMGPASTLLYTDPPATVDAFTDALIAADGVDPTTCGSRATLRECVAKYHCAPVPDVIAADIGRLLDELYDIGYRVTEARHDAEAFVNFHVDLGFDGMAIRLVRDRNQYLLDGPRDQLRALGLLKVLEKADIVHALRLYAAALSAGDAG